jgi:hypothetical protein
MFCSSSEHELRIAISEEQDDSGACDELRKVRDTLTDVILRIKLSN